MYPASGGPPLWRDQPLAQSRGQRWITSPYGPRLDGLLAQLRRDGVKVLEGPYEFGDSRAVMIEDPDGLAIELIDGRVGILDFRTSCLLLGPSL